MLAMGWRGGLVVFFSVPLTLCIDAFQLLYVGLYAEQNHAFRIGFVVGW